MENTGDQPLPVVILPQSPTQLEPIRTMGRVGTKLNNDNPPAVSHRSGTAPVSLVRRASEVPAVDHWFKKRERFWDSAHVYLQRA